MGRPLESCCWVVALGFAFAGTACGRTRSSAHQASVAGAPNSEGGAPDGGSGAQAGSGGGPLAGAGGDAGSESTNGGATCDQTSPGAMMPQGCETDADCAGGYCEPEACSAANCACVEGAWVCGVCRSMCSAWPVACGDTDAFTAQLQGDVCVVLLHVNGATGALSEYALSCGPLAPIEPADALAKLLPLSSVNWSGAKALGDAADSELIAFRVSFSGVVHTRYCSALTGLNLVETTWPGGAIHLQGASGDLAWRDPSELGTTCAPHATLQLGALDSGDALSLTSAATHLGATGLLQALHGRFAQVSPLFAVEADGTPNDLLVFTTASAPNATR